MALATTCPYCKISFKVVKDQLKLQRGRVRCGACQRVFAGLDFLVRIPDEPRLPDAAPDDAATRHAEDDLKTAFFLPETVMVAPQGVRDHAPLASGEPPVDDDGAAIVGTTDLDLLALESSLTQTPQDADFEPIPIEAAGWPGVEDDSRIDTWGAACLPEPGEAEAADAGSTHSAAQAQPAVTEEEPVASASDSSGGATATGDARTEPEPEPEPDTRPMPDVQPPSDVTGDDGLPPEPALDDRDVIESIVATSPAGDLDDDPAPAGAQAPPGGDERGAGRGRIAAGHDEDESAIDYFSSGHRGVGFIDRHGPLALLGAALLVLALGLQWTIAQRSVIAARAPSLAPAMAALLGPFGLRIELPRDLESLTIESFELQSSATHGVLAMSALLRNRADHAVQWPSMQLTLTDPANRVLVRKVLGPGDYLRESRSGEGLPPHAEWPVRLALEADDLQPAGYSVILFYP